MSTAAIDNDLTSETSTAGGRRRARTRALLLIGLFLVVGIAYSLVVPPFETPDEPFHYAFARHIAQGNGLPVQSAESTGPWQQEGSQAPLYYLLTGWLTRGIDQGDFAALAMRNPRANIGDPLYPGNKNFMLYSGRVAPLAGSNLALHLGRWLSLVLAAGTLWFVFLTAELAFPRRNDLPLLAMALVAAIPQFAFIGASFSNDTLVVAASTVAVYWLARLVSRPDARPIRWWEWVVLGVFIGLAVLSKLQALGLVPLAGVAALFLAWQRRDGKLALVAAVGVGVPALAITGWWFARNLVLYGDWSGLGHLMDINGRRGGELDWEDLWPEFRGLRYSFWGLFGWFNILLPGWFYTLMDVVTVAGAVGAVAALVQRWRTALPPRLRDGSLRVLLLLALWAAIVLGLLVYWTVQATGSQGRLIFPGLVAFAVLLTLGLDFWLRWLPLLGRRLAWGALFAVLLGMSVLALTRLLPASYQAPPPVTKIPADAQRLDLTVGDAEPLHLLAVTTPGETRFHPGEQVPITLFLQAERPLRQDYQLFVQLLDETGAEVANLTTHPGWGRLPTTLWQPGAVYADSYLVPVTGAVDVRSPLRARVYTGFIDPDKEAQGNLPLAVRTAAGDEITPFVGEVTLVSHRAPEPAELGVQPAGSVFGGVIRAAGAVVPGETAISPGMPLTVTVLWEATGTPATDYTAFVHLRNAQGGQAAGFDQAPAGVRFPTRYWRAGDRIVSEFPLALPTDIAPGVYEMWLGLYETASGGALRLPVTDAAGLRSGDGEVRIGEIRVE